MAIPKVCGIETEYGIVARNLDDDNPVLTSSLLINSYVTATAQKVGWDFLDESPASDARGVTLADFFAPEIETNLVNTVLPNGARYYVDHAHPEISTPEVRDAREAVVWDRAADEIIVASMEYAARYLDGGELIIYKNNSDGKGHSYGCHENYLVDRAVEFGRLAYDITPHLVTRQIFCGAGKVGSEYPDYPADEVAYQISQRADFFEEPIGLETTIKRPIVNTRDEPHADPAKYRRLHVIVGDANMSEVATYLKLGTTAIILAMIEDQAVNDELHLLAPVAAMTQIGHDPNLEAVIQLTDGRYVTALEVQWSLLQLAQKYASSHGLEAVGEAVGADVLQRWEAVLTMLESNPTAAAGIVDWVAKKRLVDGYAQRHGLSGIDARLKAIDLQYHDLRPAKSLAARVGLQTLVSNDEVRHAMTHPPQSTRAYFRGRVLEKFADDIVTANWDSIVFDVGIDPLRRVPMMEPLRGTAEHVAKLIDASTTARELVERLEG